MDPRFNPLAALLRERLAVIADHALRDRDPAAHLEKLKQVSEAILAQQQELRPLMPPRLAHFMEQCSYEKALALIEERPVPGPH